MISCVVVGRCADDEAMRGRRCWGRGSGGLVRWAGRWVRPCVCPCVCGVVGLVWLCARVPVWCARVLLCVLCVIVLLWGLCGCVPVCCAVARVCAPSVCCWGLVLCVLCGVPRVCPSVCVCVCCCGACLVVLCVCARVCAVGGLSCCAVVCPCVCCACAVRVPVCVPVCVLSIYLLDYHSGVAGLFIQLSISQNIVKLILPPPLLLLMMPLHGRFCAVLVIVILAPVVLCPPPINKYPSNIYISIFFSGLVCKGGTENQRTRLFYYSRYTHYYFFVQFAISLIDIMAV